jgi:hypothetical protein
MPDVKAWNVLISGRLRETNSFGAAKHLAVSGGRNNAVRGELITDTSYGGLQAEC